MTDIICMVCKREILAESFRFDNELGGFVHVKCKPCSTIEFEDEAPLSRSIKKFNHPVAMFEELDKK